MRCRIWMLLVLVVVSGLEVASVAWAEAQWATEHTWKVTEPPVAIARTSEGNRTFLLTAAHTVLILGEDGEQEAAIPVDATVTDIDISPKGDHLYLISPQRREVTTIAIKFMVKFDLSGSPFLGMADAPVVIVIFSDFQCPYCSKLVGVMAEVLDYYPEQVKIVFKNYPLSQHQLAEPAARAALAAAAQGRFWPYHDRLFQNYKTLTKYKLLQFATELGLDLSKFSADMVSVATRRQLNRDMQQGRQAGLTGTPTVFINGQRLKNSTLPGFKKVIDKELARAGQQGGGPLEK